MIKRFKEKAQIFLDEDIRAFIITSDGDWNYCDIIVVGEKFCYVEHFGGHKIGTKQRIFYVDIIKFDEFKEKEGDG